MKMHTIQNKKMIIKKSTGSSMVKTLSFLGLVPGQVTKLPQQYGKNKKHVFLRDDSAATLSKHPGLFLTKLGTYENNIIRTSFN